MARLERPGPAGPTDGITPNLPTTNICVYIYIYTYREREIDIDIHT